MRGAEERSIHVSVRENMLPRSARSHAVRFTFVEEPTPFQGGMLNSVRSTGRPFHAC